MRMLLFEGSPQDISEILGRISWVAGNTLEFFRDGLLLADESEPDPEDHPGKDGGLDRPPIDEKYEGTTSKTEYKKPCGPSKRVTWRFKDGKVTGSTVNEWEYDADCNVIRHKTWTFDENGTRETAKISGKHTLSKHNTKRHKKWEYYEWVWEKGATTPTKYHVSVDVEYDDDGKETHHTEKREVVS